MNTCKSKSVFGWCNQRILLTTSVKLLIGVALIGGVEAAELPTITSYRPPITESVDSSGFVHPGVGLTKSHLENLRNQIEAQQEPWYTHYQAMVQSAAADRNVISSNATIAAPTTPISVVFNSQGFNSRFVADGLKAYTQALLYIFTGDEVYRSNAMNIIRVWQKMDPSQYTYFTDAVIHTGVPLNRMMAAAEILRYSGTQNPSLAWTEDDTVKLTSNLITPVTETFVHSNGAFMNQHTYALQGAMAGYIFTGNLDRYKEAVEWMTVNKNAPNQGFNGSIKQLFRLVDRNAKTGQVLQTPVVQHVEMGRDQAHGGGDLTNATIIGNMFYAQNTKVDPVTGEVSTASNAVGMYEFLGDRVLAAADYFWKYMAGYQTDWVPTEYSIFPDGRVGGTYDTISRAYRGRMATTNFWGLYYYYTYEKGVDVETIAPYFYQGFKKRIPTVHYSGRGQGNLWNSPDAGGDYWLYIPPQAAAEGATNLPKPHLSASIVQPEERYTSYDLNSETVNQSGVEFIRLTSSPTQTHISLIDFSYGARPASLLYGIKLRTNGVAKLTLSEDPVAPPYIEIELPNTNNEWRYIVYDAGTAAVKGNFGDSLAYIAAIGNGTVIDIDHFNVNAATELTAPVFASGIKNQTFYTYLGASISTSFSATDTNSADVLTYSADQLPSGANLNAQTGEFTWTPSAAGTHSFQLSVTDGTSAIAKRVTIYVDSDRAEAIESASENFDSTKLYSASSLSVYQHAYNAATAGLNNASDADFHLLLGALLSATNNLKLVNPRLADGSLDYTATVVTSTFGTLIGNMVDSFSGSASGVRRLGNLFDILDFGIDHKVSATAFGIQARESFPDRGAGIAVFGSNDSQNWTRLTPDESAYQVDMSILPVDAAYQNTKYRYFKVEMINPQKDSLRDEMLYLYEMGEFRIYGDRHALSNKVDSVDVTSPIPGVNGLLTSNGEVTLALTTKEVVSNLNVKVEGVQAQVSTQDGIHWVVNVNLGANFVAGALDYYIEYTNTQGDTNDAFIQSGSYLIRADDLINNITSIAAFIDPSTSFGRPSASVTAQQVAVMFDNNADTVSDFRIGGSGSGGYITFDFKQGGSVSLTSVDFLSRQDTYFGRIGGAVLQASNDNVNWINITNTAIATKNWQSLVVSNNQRFRYVRIFNGANWFGNIAEVRFHGNYLGPVDAIQSISIASAQSSANGLIKKGDTATLIFGVTESIAEMAVEIQGVPATVEKLNESTWRASAVMQGEIRKGYLTFSADYITSLGRTGANESAVTDSSKLYLIESADLLENPIAITNLIDPSTVGGRPNVATTTTIAGYLFDGNASTIADFRNGSNGSGGYITFDFKEGNSVWFSGAELLARQDQYHTRANNAVIQGSNDNLNWTNISSLAISTLEWQSLTSTATQKYRYLRLYNASNWFGNVAELRLHIDNVKPITTIVNVDGSWKNQDANVSFTVKDIGAGVKSTHYQIGAGAITEGSNFVVNAQGVTDLIFWSEDLAGNIEDLKTAIVKIDKDAPEIFFKSDDEAIEDGEIFNMDEQITVDAEDALSGLKEISVEVGSQVITTDINALPLSINLNSNPNASQVRFYAIDLAGNEVTKTLNFSVNVPNTSSSSSIATGSSSSSVVSSISASSIESSAPNTVSSASSVSSSLNGSSVANSSEQSSSDTESSSSTSVQQSSAGNLSSQSSGGWAYSSANGSASSSAGLNVSINLIDAANLNGATIENDDEENMPVVRIGVGQSVSFPSIGVPFSGKHTIKFRVKSTGSSTVRISNSAVNSNGGQKIARSFIASLFQKSESGEIGVLTVESTNGQWETKGYDLNFDSGELQLSMEVISGEVVANWISLQCENCSYNGASISSSSEVPVSSAASSSVLVASSDASSSRQSSAVSHAASSQTSSLNSGGGGSTSSIILIIILASLFSKQFHLRKF